MKYHTVAEARGMSGLRLALIGQTPSPWGFAARTLLDLRKVPFVPVRQDAMAANEDLVAWTGRRNAPVAVYEDEPAVDGWLEILNLAERLGEGPSLLPADPVDRALAIGFSAEICGHNGFGWARRIAMAAAAQMDRGDDPAAQVMRDYGVAANRIAEAQQRTAAVMRGLATQLHRQQEAGSQWLVGQSLSACDVHWACFSQLVSALPEDAITMPPALREMFNALSDVERDALAPILVEHRDRVWQEHIGLPFDYLPDGE